MIGAGYVHAKCRTSQASYATAAAVEKYSAALAYVLGDNAGIHGAAGEYDCYDQSRGRFKARTLPVIGHHERNVDPTVDA